jgi:hypothetical protein
VRELAPDTALLVEDETDLLLFPPLRAGWAKEGKPAAVRLTGWNARRVVFGTMDLQTGDRLLHVRERQRSGEFQPLLAAVRERYGVRPIAVLLDEDSSHTAKASVALAQELAIRLLWFPKRAPELNPMDTLWRHAKDLICANRQYETIEEQARRFVQYLASLPNQDALRMAGIQSPDFWLRSALSKDFCGSA